MRISVVIPTRERAGSLAATLRGVAMQVHDDLEIVLVDDGSSEAAARANRALLEASARPFQYVHVAAHGPGGSGPGRARNIGIARATGTFVTFCDDDDAWTDPQHLSRVALHAANAPQADLYFANQRAMRDDAVLFEYWLPAYTTKVVAARGLDGSIIPVRRAECLSRAGDFPHGNTCVVRKTLLDEIGGYWEGVRYASDMDLFVRMADRAREIYFQCATVARHDVPNPALRNNVSTRRSADGKAFDLAMIAEHLMFHCLTPEARAYAKDLGGQALRALAISRVQTGDRVSAASWARQALVLHPTWKWFAYTGFLRFGAMLTRLG